MKTNSFYVLKFAVKRRPGGNINNKFKVLFDGIPVKTYDSSNTIEDWQTEVLDVFATDN